MFDAIGTLATRSRQPTIDYGNGAPNCYVSEPEGKRRTGSALSGERHAARDSRSSRGGAIRDRRVCCGRLLRSGYLQPPLRSPCGFATLGISAAGSFHGSSPGNDAPTTHTGLFFPDVGLARTMIRNFREVRSLRSCHTLPPVPSAGRESVK